MKEFPPYPSHWIILSEETVDERFEPDERYLYRSVSFAVVADGYVSLGDATYWLSPDQGSWCGKEWAGSPDSGSYLTIEDFKKIIDHLPL